MKKEEQNRLNLYKRIVPIAIVVVVVISLILIIFISYSDKKLKEQKKTQNKSQVTSQLPISKESDYRIGYDAKRSQVIAVEIFAKNKEEFLQKKQLAVETLKQSGAIDLCSLQVRFIPVGKTLRSQIENKDIFPESCPLPDWAK